MIIERDVMPILMHSTSGSSSDTSLRIQLAQPVKPHSIAR
jgi:hypothetical protein